MKKVSWFAVLAVLLVQTSAFACGVGSVSGSKDHDDKSAGDEVASLSSDAQTKAVATV